MQTLQRTFRAAADLAAGLPQLQDFTPDLLLIHAAPAWFETPAALESLLAAFPGRCLGCSTAGEIAGSAVLDDHCVVTALRFDTTALSIHEADIASTTDSYAAGQRIARSVVESRPDLLIVFAPGTAVDGARLVEGLMDELPQRFPISGGLAGDGGRFHQTWTIGPSGIHSDRVVAVALKGPGLRFGHGSYGGWKPFGPIRRVSRCEGNRLYRLESERALDVYRRYLGEYAHDLPASGLLFPFSVLDENGQETGLIRTIIGIDDESGSLILAGSVREGSFLQLMHTNSEGLVDGAEVAAERAFAPGVRDNASLALLVSCIGRKLLLGERVEDEVEAALQMGPRNLAVAGFYSNGEIGPSGLTSDCRLHNQTMTITLIGEAQV